MQAHAVASGPMHNEKGHGHVHKRWDADPGTSVEGNLRHLSKRVCLQSSCTHQQRQFGSAKLCGSLSHWI